MTIKSVYLSSFILLSLMIIGCRIGPEVTDIVHKETIKMILFPEEKFKPLKKYSIAGVTFLPYVVRHSKDKKFYFCIRSYTKDNKVDYVVENLVVKIRNPIKGNNIYQDKTDEKFEKCFNGFYTKIQKLREYNYHDINLLENGNVEFIVTISVIKDEKKITKKINYVLEVLKKRYSSW